MADDIRIRRDDHVLVVAPHPDDESVATGALLQRAKAAGAGISLLYLTDGDRNPWAQRAAERRIWIGPTQRRLFAALRRLETASALAALGAHDAPLFRLALPDQGLTAELLAGDGAVDGIAEVVRAQRPSLVAFPSIADLHPDHSAAALLVRFALERAALDPPPRRLCFLVHNPERDRLPVAAELRLSAGERARKRTAIECHSSQLFWRRSWLLSFAAERESYVEPAAAGRHPVAGARRTAGGVELELRTRPHLRAAGSRTVLLLPPFGGAGLAVRIPALGSSAPVREVRGGRRIGTARWTGGPFRGTLALPVAMPAGPLLAKLERGLGFFDEAGWRELAAE